MAESAQQVELAVLKLSAEETEGRSTLQAADAALQTLRTNIEALHARRSEIEVDLVRKESDLKYLDETSRKELGCALAEIDGVEILDGEALDEAERGYQEVRSKIEALGAINPEALAEYWMACSVSRMESSRF